MFELDHSRVKKHCKRLQGGWESCATNGKHYIIREVDGGYWMAVPIRGEFDLYPMVRIV